MLHSMAHKSIESTLPHPSNMMLVCWGVLPNMGLFLRVLKVSQPNEQPPIHFLGLMLMLAQAVGRHSLRRISSSDSPEAPPRCDSVRCALRLLGVSESRGPLCGGSYHEDYSVLGYVKMYPPKIGKCSYPNLNSWGAKPLVAGS